MKFNYPTGSKATTPKMSQAKVSMPPIYGKRGMSLEEELNESNAYYLSHGVAVIHKKPTPIQIVKVDYPKRSAAQIKEAYFSKASTTDYNGVYRGKYIDFDAKETTNSTSFPLSNFHEHQINHMKDCEKVGGICFTIIKFVKLNKIFLLKTKDLFQFWDSKENGGRKSIPLSVFEEQGYQLGYQMNPLIPYLKAVDKIIENL
ncbi:Holliday junction resolvase RecU [Pediococcus pentosaceus]|uniref:Holliday junction resolvase RecU n=1 Tax=Pediococcus pentosaceus TaxID=1255 RepID=A0A6L5A3D1_PEDPE|nr:Holliday junction resolvase RecU [Pediococcus pentosaceus]ANI97919.1 Holliday junction resolvase RecU [Pediococcus pentosaceus]ASC08515.1 Holliday junction resolvase RecU [Pediococcus pentosaceus]AVL01495.1 Holliday junction resolvase RecU [Pediococcus pentosaceus]KAF0415038.1 Holliday junction resolvase RecU [Pediococcus pentosaceus]KAF0502719.1 Holliday junction resolvase RecU [Pediococcus pentosaceus]